MRKFSDDELERLRVNSLEKPYEPSAQIIPLEWTADHLQQRIIDCYATLRRMPRVRGPRAPGNHGPQYVHDWEDRLSQVSDPTMLKEIEADKNRDRSQPTALEIEHMEHVIEFLRMFRGQDAQGSLVLARWGFAKAFGSSVAKQAQALGMAKSSFYARLEAGTKACASMLNRNGAGVF